MNSKTIWCAMVFGCTYGLALAQSTEIVFTRVQTSFQSAQREPACLAARNERELQDLAKRHGAPPVPAPGALVADTRKHMIVGVFLGERSSSGYSMAVKSVRRQESRIVITYQEYTPSPDGIYPAAMVVLTEFIQIPKSPLPVECRGLKPIRSDLAMKSESD